MSIKVISKPLVAACSGGQWLEATRAAIQATTPVACLCVAEESGMGPVHGGLYMRMGAIERCYKSCCEAMKVIPHTKIPITHFIT